ncbi:YggT family protein [Pacificispira sp.]|uniref:YggT family protein n=1 Tax=Pacificispira sp. TaxID=2888761 RepID=UPI003B516CAF
MSCGSVPRALFLSAKGATQAGSNEKGGFSKMDVIIGPLFTVINLAIQFYFYLIIASAVMSWLVALNVINTSNRFVYMIGDFLYRVTEPALRPIRRVLPDLGPVDLSPIVLILILIFLQMVLANIAASLI